MHVATWLAAFFVGQLVLRAFLGFAVPTGIWWRRAFSALLGLGWLMALVALAYVLLSNRGPFLPEDPKLIGTLILFNALMGVWIFTVLRDFPLSCSSALLRLVGCLAAGILLACMLVFGLGASIALLGQLAR